MDESRRLDDLRGRTKHVMEEDVRLSERATVLAARASEAADSLAKMRCGGGRWG